jgi:hypothetical protein
MGETSSTVRLSRVNRAGRWRIWWLRTSQEEAMVLRSSRRRVALDGQALKGEGRSASTIKRGWPILDLTQPDPARGGGDIKRGLRLCAALQRHS